MYSDSLIVTFLVCSFTLVLSLPEPTHEPSPFPSRRLLTCSTTPSSSIVQQFLVPHNTERAKLGLPPLKWSNKLARFAARWAWKRRGDCALLHSRSSDDYGENLFWGSGKDWKAGDAVAAWGEERSYYNHDTNTCSRGKDCLHYTQMVWRQTLKIGCASVICTTGDTFITCNYHPHGNVVGQKPF